MASPILICPLRPDLDCIGGSLAYAALYGGKIWIGGPPDGEAQYYLNRFAPALAPLIASDDEAYAADAYALVDLSTAHILPAFVDTAKVSTVIDHRFLHDPQHDFPNATVQLENVGAAATLVAERFMQQGKTPSMEIAAVLHGAIWSNNLGFTSALTTDRDRAAFDWCRQYLTEPQALIDGQLQARRDDILADLPGTLALETKHYDLPVFAYRFAQLELIDAAAFWRDHRPAICAALNADARPAMLNLIDLTGGTSLLYTQDATLSAALAAIHNIEFQDDVAQVKPARMRKQIAADLAERLSI